MYLKAAVLLTLFLCVFEGRAQTGPGLDGIPSPSLATGSSNTAGPVVSFSSPAPGARLSHPTVVLRGTARDIYGVASVEFRVENVNGVGAYVPATGTNRWSATADNLAPGTNIVWVRAWDTLGNVSAEIARPITYVVLTPLTLLVNGTGRVTPDLRGRKLEIGRTYRVAAVEAAGWRFYCWTGDTPSSSPELSFRMQSNFIAQANFVPSPFLPLKGSYYGLFSDTNGLSVESAGQFVLTLTGQGSWSSRLQMGANAVALSGKFGLEGTAQANVKRRNASPLEISLQLDLLDGTERLTGTVTDGRWTADLRANRCVLKPGIPPFVRKKFTILIPPDSPAGPAGPGYGLASLDDAGRMRLLGSALADGTAITQAIPTSKDGEWPLYVPLYSGSGLLFGWLHFDTTGVNNPQGTLTWLRPAQSRVPRYPAGFTNETTVIGALYRSPKDLAQLAWTNGEIAFSGGEAFAPFTNRITLRPDFRVVNHSSNPIALTLFLSTGWFKGSVTPPGSTLRLPFQGALQNWFGSTPTVGSGYWLEPAKSGELTLQPAAILP